MSGWSLTPGKPTKRYPLGMRHSFIANQATSSRSWVDGAPTVVDETSEVVVVLVVVVVVVGPVVFVVSWGSTELDVVAPAVVGEEADDDGEPEDVGPEEAGPGSTVLALEIDEVVPVPSGAGSTSRSGRLGGRMIDTLDRSGGSGACGRRCGGRIGRDHRRGRIVCGLDPVARTPVDDEPRPAGYHRQAGHGSHQRTEATAGPLRLLTTEGGLEIIEVPPLDLRGWGAEELVAERFR